MKQTLRKDAINKYFKTNTWEPAQERDLNLHLCRNRCHHSSTPHRTAIREKKVSVYTIMIFSFSHEAGGGYLLHSKAEILSFKSKLLEIVKKVKPDVIAQDALLDQELTIDFSGLSS